MIFSKVGTYFEFCILAYVSNILVFPYYERKNRLIWKMKHLSGGNEFYLIFIT